MYKIVKEIPGMFNLETMNSRMRPFMHFGIMSIPKHIFTYVYGFVQFQRKRERNRDGDGGRRTGRARE